MVWTVKHGRGFSFPEYKTNYPRQPTYKLLHINLRVWLHIFDKRIDGEVDITFQPLLGELDHIVLDAVDMDIKKVESVGRKVNYKYDGEKLYIYFGDKLNSSDKYTVTVSYSTEPKKGLYFILPDKSHPDRIPQVWSQGEPDDTRYWIPVYDYPNNRCTWEIIAYAPKDFTVLSNGELLNREEKEDWVIWHWRNDTPQPTYLITIVVGIFDYVKEYFEDVPLFYYVPKGMGVHINRTFSRTKDILEFFSEYTGVKYPYKRYTQVCVSEFIAGGMENTTLTVLTEWTLHDEKAHLDFESEPLVAHEAAHQWFGDLVTMKDWGNLWLNESFATYFENLYLRHWKGEEEFIYAMYSDLKAYLREYSERYARPIVTRVYKYPEELFDAHSYPKGGLVLHTLMNLIGEDTFRKAVNVYLERFKFKSIDTEDMRKVFEEVSGIDLEWFFDQYVYNAGHPVLKVSYKWMPKEKILQIILKQTQGKDSLDVYKMRLDIELVYPEKTILKTFDMYEREQTLMFHLEEQPEVVLVDPHFKNFMVLEYDYSMDDLLKILKVTQKIYPKLIAIQSLSKHKSNRVLRELRNILLNKEEFWGVRATAVKTIGAIGGEKALDILIEAEEKVTNKKVRRAIAQSLGEFKEAKAAETLKKILEDKEESYYVRASAAESLGKTKYSEATEILLSEINTPSHNHVITRGVLKGLAEIGSDEALKILIRYTDKLKPTLIRIDAIASLGNFPKNKDAYEVIKHALRDENVRIRSAAVLAIKKLMDPEFLPELDRISSTDLFHSLRRRAREVATKIRESLEKGTEYVKLREEIEKLKEEQRLLLDRVEKLEHKY